MNINRMFCANKKEIMLVVQNHTAEKKNVMFYIYIYIVLNVLQQKNAAIYSAAVRFYRAERSV